MIVRKMLQESGDAELIYSMAIIFGFTKKRNLNIFGGNTFKTLPFNAKSLGSFPKTKEPFLMFLNSTRPPKVYNFFFRIKQVETCLNRLTEKEMAIKRTEPATTHCCLFFLKRFCARWR